MTTHGAIKILRNTAWLGTNEDREKTEQAIEVVAKALDQEPTIEQLMMDDIEYLKKIIKKKKELMEKGEWTDADRLELMLCEIQPYSMYWQMGMIGALEKAIKLLRESDER